MLLDETKIETLRRLIEQSENVVVVSHVNPDGDALGSAMGLRAALARRDKNVTAMLPSVYPDYFGFLPAAESILVDEKEHDRCVEAIAKADLIVLADLNQIKRTDKLAESIRQSAAPKVLIDHHPNPETEPMAVVFSDTDISSASELAYWVVCQLYGSDFINKSMATCFYSGICTDTGSFSFSCNHRSVYEAVGNMVETGIDINGIHDSIFNVFSESRVRFLGYCLTDLLKVHSDIRMAYIAVSLDDQKRFNLEEGDMESIVNYTLSMRHIRVGVLIKETPRGVRMSFRSKGEFNVNDFAAKYFNGGGHRRASGATSPYDFATTEAKLVEHLYNELKPNAQ